MTDTARNCLQATVKKLRVPMPQIRLELIRVTLSHSLIILIRSMKRLTRRNMKPLRASLKVSRMDD